MNSEVVEISAFVTEGYYLLILTTAFQKTLISRCAGTPLEYRNTTIC